MKKIRCTLLVLFLSVDQGTTIIVGVYFLFWNAVYSAINYSRIIITYINGTRKGFTKSGGMKVVCTCSFWYSKNWDKVSYNGISWRSFWVIEMELLVIILISRKKYW